MNQIAIIINYTLKEALKRKIVYAYLILVSLSLLIIYFTTTLTTGNNQSGVAEISIHGTSLQAFATMLTAKVVAGFGGFFSLMVFFSTLTVFPLLFNKGEAELFLTKPVNRTSLILGRFMGGVILGMLTALVFSIGVFTIVGVRFSIWDASIFMFPAYATVGMCAIFSGAGVIAMLTNSPVAGLILSYSMFLLPPAKEMLSVFPAVKPFAQAVAAIVPNTGLFFSGFPADAIRGVWDSSMQQLVIAGLFIIINFAVTILIFEKKDI